MQVYSIESSEVRQGNRSILTNWIAKVCILWHWVMIHTQQFYMSTLIPLKSLLSSIINAVSLLWRGWSWECWQKPISHGSWEHTSSILESNFTYDITYPAKQEASHGLGDAEGHRSYLYSFCPKINYAETVTYAKKKKKKILLSFCTLSLQRNIPQKLQFQLLVQ